MYRLSVTFLVTVFALALSVMSLPVTSENTLMKRTTGEATFYETGLGACGRVNHNSDMVVALATPTYAKGKNCGRQVTITDKKNHKTATATVVDLCPGCAAGDLDLSPSLFKKFEKLDVGRFAITWSFI